MKTEDNRLREYYHLKTVIRGSNAYLIVGIDVGKDKHNAFLGTATGKSLYRRLMFDNSQKGFELLLAQVESVKLQNNLKHIVFGVEPTANFDGPVKSLI